MCPSRVERPMVPEESGTTSVPEGAVATVQDVGTASVPEGAGVAVGQERSESEADSVLGNSPSYADHVQGPGTPPSIPSLEPERFSPSPKEAAHPAEGFASGSIQPETADDEARGKWTAPDVPSAPAAQPAGLEDREPKRPRKGLPAGVRVELSPVPVPGEAEDRLLRELFRQEQERRIEEAMALGIHLRPGENEPRPLLSHYFGRPAAVEDMYDSLSQALTNRDRSFWTRVSLGQGASSRYLPGGSSSVYGLNRLERPEEMMAPTPFHPKLPAYPEPEPRPQLMVDASTITDNAADQWSEWLRSARQGRSRNTGRNTRSSMRTAPDVGGAGSAKSGHRSSSAMKSSRLFFCQLSHTASPQVGPCQVHHSRRSQDVGQVAVREAASSWQDVGRRLSDLRIRSNDGQVDHLSTAHQQVVHCMGSLRGEQRQLLVLLVDQAARHAVVPQASHSQVVRLRQAGSASSASSHILAEMNLNLIHHLRARVIGNHQTLSGGFLGDLSRGRVVAARRSRGPSDSVQGDAWQPCPDCLTPTTSPAQVPQPRDWLMVWRSMKSPSSFNAASLYHATSVFFEAHKQSNSSSRSLGDQLNGASYGLSRAGESQKTAAYGRVD